MRQRNILLVIVTVFSSCVMGQSEHLHVQYEVVFNTMYDRPVSKLRALKAHLYTSVNESLFFMNPDYDFQDSKSELEVPLDTVWRIKMNASEHQLIFEDFIDSKNGPTWYTDSLHPMKWSLAEDVKYIDSFNCQKATCHFRGRDYVAWYCPTIPYSSGPWKFGGLPGLIMELEEVKGDLQIFFAGIRESPPILQRTVTKTYSFQDYVRTISALKQVLEESSTLSDCLTCDSKGKLYLWEKDLPPL